MLNYYKNHSCLGNKYKGYKHICSVKLAKSTKASAVKARRIDKNHQIAHPIYLPPLSTSPESVKTVGGAEDVILKIPGLAGFQMKVKANSVTFPDGSRVGTLVVSPVTADKLPMSPPGGAAAFSTPAWTIQPAGTRFDPPIEVTLPNENGNPAGDNLPIVQWDHDLSQFVPMGRATVSEDGAVLVCDSGSGITKAGWGGAPPPPPPPKCQPSRPKDCNECQKFDNGGGDCPTGQCVTDAKKDGNKLSTVNISKISYSTSFVDRFKKATSAATRAFGVEWDCTGEITAGPITVDKTCCSTAASGQAKNFEFNGVGGATELSLKIPVFLIVKKLTGYFFTDMAEGTTLNVRLAVNGTGIRAAYDECKNEGSTAGKLAGSLEATVSLANVTFATSGSATTSDPNDPKNGAGVFRPLELGVNGQVDWTLTTINKSEISGPVHGTGSIFGKSQFSIGSFNATLIDISIPFYNYQDTLSRPIGW